MSALYIAVLRMALALSPTASFELAGAITDASIEAPIDGDERRTAALLIVTAWRESLFDQSARGPHTCSMFQIWSTPEACVHLTRDLAYATRTAREYLRQSLAACPELPVPPVPDCPCCNEGGERLAFYVSGTCSRGRNLSRDRTALAAWLLRRVQP